MHAKSVFYVLSLIQFSLLLQRASGGTVSGATTGTEIATATGIAGSPSGPVSTATRSPRTSTATPAGAKATALRHPRASPSSGATAGASPETAAAAAAEIETGMTDETGTGTASSGSDRNASAKGTAPRTANAMEVSTGARTWAASERVEPLTAATGTAASDAAIGIETAAGSKGEEGTGSEIVEIGIAIAMGSEDGTGMRIEIEVLEGEIGIWVSSARGIRTRARRAGGMSRGLFQRRGRTPGRSPRRGRRRGGMRRPRRESRLRMGAERGLRSEKRVRFRFLILFF